MGISHNILGTLRSIRIFIVVSRNDQHYPEATQDRLEADGALIYIILTIAVLIRRVQSIHHSPETTRTHQPFHHTSLTFWRSMTAIKVCAKFIGLIEKLLNPNFGYGIKMPAIWSFINKLLSWMSALRARPGQQQC